MCHEFDTRLTTFRRQLGKKAVVTEEELEQVVDEVEKNAQKGGGNKNIRRMRIS